MRFIPENSEVERLTRVFTHAILRLYSFMLKNLAFLFLWFFVTPPLLFFAILFAARQNHQFNLYQSYPQIANEEFKIDNDMEGQVLAVKIQDIRPYLVSRFLQNTPLEPYSEYIVEVSDNYSIDYRLIPAIAMKESGGGISIDQSSHNAWGWENGRTYFSSWQVAIETVAKALKNNYIAKGLITPEEIMTVYAPPQIYNGGKWAKDINHFFSQMETL